MMDVHSSWPRALQAEDETMNEINMIPFIDVMLVLLIVFIITVPVMQHASNVQLPRASSEPVQQQSQAVALAVRADGSYWMGDERLPHEQLQQRLQRVVSSEQTTAQLNISADRHVQYEHVAQAIAAAQRAGIAKIALISTPASAGDDP